ncbi:MAG: TetR/AcrR family transcriptional regulator [Rothia sp. (in: high G+C Gram-positive bacteria)]|nr:TetR/AcrR family transcriptional regulator [Rothia sp. (in: high G+C Gram-positive bacteria)]
MAQHRAVQHRAVLEAAERLIVNGHGKVPTVGEIATEVGLARPSIYRYISSQHDLLVQLLILATETWNEKLEDWIKAVPEDPAPRICAYVDATLDLFLHGSHGALMVATQSFPTTFADERVQKSHAGFVSVMKKFCPGLSPVDISLLNAAILKAAEQPIKTPDLARATETLYKMAIAIVADAAPDSTPSK